MIVVRGTSGAPSRPHLPAADIHITGQIVELDEPNSGQGIGGATGFSHRR